MKRSILTKAVMTLMLFFSLVTISSAVNGPSGKRENVLKTCENLFGKAVDSKENLFEINALYALEPKFDPKGVLVELTVFPKYFREESHPDWTEPETRVRLTRAEYGALLARRKSIKPKGKLVRRGKGTGIVTNSSDYYTDAYERAFSFRGEWVGDGIRFMSLYFSHEVEGKVDRKCISREGNFRGGIYNLIIDDCRYFVSKATYNRIRAGRKGNL